MGETGEVADVTGVCADTGALIGIHTETHRCRAGNHGRDHRLRKTGQSTDHAGGNTARGTHAGAAAEFIAHTDDIADDDVHKARGLHDADEKQNTRHIGNHRVQARNHHLGDGHVGRARNRKARHKRGNRCARNGGNVNRSFARNHQ